MNILEDSKESQLKIIQKLERGEIVILPSNGVYTLNTNIFNSDSIEKIYILKERDMDTPLSVAVKDFDMAKSLMEPSNMTAREYKIIKILIDEFWPGMLSLVVKTHLNNSLFTSNNYISLESPCYSSVQDILHEFEKPIITTSANINKKTSCTHINHVKNYFSEVKSITALSASTNPKYGIESTIIKIEDNNLTILRPGNITKEDISSILNNKDIEYTLNYIETDPHGVSDNHYGINKTCFLTNFVTSDILNKLHNKYTLEYLSKSIIVDFNKRNIEKRDIAAGYVDLSENGDITEALFNLYDVLHQLNHLKQNKILFIDLYSNKKGLYQTLYNRLLHCCNNRLMIPVYYT